MCICSQLRAQALPIGTIIAGDPIACSSAPNGSKFLPGMTCFGATISCPNTAPINLTFGYTGPAKPLGTIVLFSGGPGTAPTEDGDEVPVYAGSYVNKYMTVQVEWASAWEDPSADGSGGNILSAACRPATFLNYINSSGSVHPQGAMCAQGASAGSAAIAYSMSWYGSASFLQNVELISGPVLSKIDQGCTYPNASTPTICAAGTSYCSTATQPWSDRIIYVPSYNQGVSNWSGLPNCGTSQVNSANYPTWAAMSIVDGSATGATPTFSFLNTTKHGWLCSTLNQSSCSAPSCPNNSPSEGKLFYDAVSAAEGINSKLVVTGVTGCSGAEGVASGVDPDTGLKGSTAVENHMTTNCVAP